MQSAKSETLSRRPPHATTGSPGREKALTQTCPHVPVLLTEVLELLAPSEGATVIDGTLGAGGHAEALLERVGPGGRLIAIDRDPAAIEIARHRLARFGEAFLPVHGNHMELRELLHGQQAYAVDGILFDLGLSSMQLDDPQRGFSFRQDGPLDMRMDPSRGESAAELLARCSEHELRDLLSTYGEERRALAIARRVVRERERRPLERTAHLAEIVAQTLGPQARKYRIHPATRTFQALRIAVNREVEGLEQLVAEAVSLLRRGGRLAILSYHSLEDRAVKRTYRGLAQRCTCPPRMPVCGCGRENLIRILTPKPVRPSEMEVERNPRASSARLRVAERL